MPPSPRATAGSTAGSGSGSPAPGSTAARSVPRRRRSRPTSASSPRLAAAVSSGFRACRRCRPDSAPGLADWDHRATSPRGPSRLIAQGAVDDGGRRGPRRVAPRERAPPAPHPGRRGRGRSAAPRRSRRAQTARLLIEQTALPLTDVAFAAGFASIRQFNDVMRREFGLAPSLLRRVPGGVPRRGGPGPGASPAAATALRRGRRWATSSRRGRSRASRCTADGGPLDPPSGRPAARAPGGGRRRGRRRPRGAAQRRRPARHRRARAPGAPLARPRRRAGHDRRGALGRPRPRARSSRTAPVCGCRPRSTRGRRSCARSSASRCRSPARGRCSAGWCATSAPSTSPTLRAFPTAAEVAEAGPDRIAAIGMPGARARSWHAVAVAVDGGGIDLASGDLDRSATLCSRCPASVRGPCPTSACAHSATLTSCPRPTSACATAPPRSACRPPHALSRSALAHGAPGAPTPPSTCGPDLRRSHERQAFPDHVGLGARRRRRRAVDPDDGAVVASGFADIDYVFAFLTPREQARGHVEVPADVGLGATRGRRADGVRRRGPRGARRRRGPAARRSLHAARLGRAARGEGRRDRLLRRPRGTAGSPKAVRAAGQACATNKVAPFVPCHRIVRTDGSLGGYAYGLPVKEALLVHEGALL